MEKNITIDRFEYEKRTTCICGQLLPRNGVNIVKNYSRGAVNFVKCDLCGSWCQSPQLTDDSLRKWFDSSDYHGSDAKCGIAYVNYLADEQNRLKDARLRFKRDLAESLPSNARVLEVGCATATLLSVMRSSGCEVLGIDLSPKFVEAAREINDVNVLLGDLADFVFPDGHFDLIMFFGTIGNLKDLPSYLILINKLLKENGLMIFNFVAADSPLVKYFYKKRFWMFTPSVNCFMTAIGCEMVLKNCGFEIISMSNDVQRPSFQKIFNHARIKFIVPFLKYVGMEGASLPFSIPIPAVKLVKARPIIN